MLKWKIVRNSEVSVCVYMYIYMFFVNVYVEGKKFLYGAVGLVALAGIIFAFIKNRIIIYN